MENETTHSEPCQLPHGFQIVDHADGGKCLLDTTTFEYYRLPDINGKVLIGDKWFYFFDSISGYLKSDIKKALITVFCNSFEKHKKRFKATILSGRDTFDFYSVEMVNNTWTHNEVDLMQKMRPYFIFCEKQSDADNEFLIRKSKVINRHG